jgi:hypothetical protein
MTPIEQRDRVGSWLVYAWVSVVLIHICAFLSFAAGYGVYGVLGYVDGRGSPIWADVVVLIVAIVIVALPCAAAVVYGRRALAAGDRAGRVPMILGVLTGAAFVLLSAISVIGDALRVSS